MPEEQEKISCTLVETARTYEIDIGPFRFIATGLADVTDGQRFHLDGYYLSDIEEAVKAKKEPNKMLAVSDVDLGVLQDISRAVSMVVETAGKISAEEDVKSVCLVKSSRDHAQTVEEKKEEVKNPSPPSAPTPPTAAGASASVKP